ncbi:MAG: hypothetical protein RR979_05325 [Mucinivorans sp.]
MFCSSNFWLGGRVAVAQRLLIWSRGDTDIAVNNNIIKNNTASKMRISVV